MLHRCLLSAAWLVTAWAAARPVGAGEASPAELEFFEERIRPVLVEKCYRCHSARAEHVESGFLLDTRDGIRRGGDSGPGVVPGRADDSPLLAALRHQGLEMPPKEKLPDRVIDDFARWIAAGAFDPREASSEVRQQEQARQEAQAHWAYRAPRRGPIPAAAVGEVHNLIDARLAEEHQRLGLRPAPAAPPAVLLRRVFLDLVGVPPTADQLGEFLADSSPEALQRVVDRLLSSPLHGQRWGRHWMDIWRYSDWYGWNQEVRNSQKHIWRWRDWIIESVNADRAYDRMILEMLAGDELEPTNPQVLRATGFLARNWYRYDRNLWLATTVEHTGKAFLGLTISCARCHDHKFDPISQLDYYRLRACFEPHDVRLDPLPGQMDPEQDGLPRVYDAHADRPTYRFIRGNDKQPDQDHPLSFQVPAALDRGPLPVAAVELPRSAYLVGLEGGYQQALLSRQEGELRAAAEKLAGARAAVAALAVDVAAETRLKTLGDLALAEAQCNVDRTRLESLRAALAADVARYREFPADQSLVLSQQAAALARQAAGSERRAAVAAARQQLLAAEVALAGLARQFKPDAEIAAQQAQVRAAGERLAAAEKALAEPSERYTSQVKSYPSRSTGRRLALARWIVDRQNPLTARVAVNHIWARHFGRPLVATTFNFGRQGQPPTHPQLLDDLAVELMESGWSMKHLHRLIVTSAAYGRQSWAGPEQAAEGAVDPENRWLWRQEPRRMDAETVRDSLLAVAGELDLALGGPPLDEKTALTTRRRSLYYRHTPQDRARLLELFDAADPEASYERPTSIVPQQALALLNSSLARDSARAAAAALSAESGSSSDEAFVEAAYWRVLNRRPAPAEARSCRDFLQRQAELLARASELTAFAGPGGARAAAADPPRRARENLLQVLLNHNDFVTIR
jgi:hypothetical protein